MDDDEGAEGKKEKEKEEEEEDSPPAEEMASMTEKQLEEVQFSYPYLVYGRGLYSLRLWLMLKMKPT